MFIYILIIFFTICILVGNLIIFSILLPTFSALYIRDILCIMSITASIINYFIMFVWYIFFLSDNDLIKGNLIKNSTKGYQVKITHTNIINTRYSTVNYTYLNAVVFFIMLSVISPIWMIPAIILSGPTNVISIYCLTIRALFSKETYGY